MLRRLGTLLAALMLVFVALPAFAAGSSNALVRVIHASPDAPAVDVFVDGTAVLTGVTFPAISNYLSVPAGSHRFQVAPAGAGAAAAVIDVTADVQAGAAYTVAAIGQLANANIKGQIYSDNLAAPAAGKAHVRVLHLSPDAPAVDLKTQDNAATLFSNLAYPNASAYLPVDAGTYDLKVTAAGSTDAVVSLNDVALSSGVVYDAVAVGLLDDSTLKVVLASYTPAALPNTGVADMPVALLAAAAVAVLASGMVLRRRSA